MIFTKKIILLMQVSFIEKHHDFSRAFIASIITSIQFQGQ